MALRVVSRAQHSLAALTSYDAPSRRAKCRRRPLAAVERASTLMASRQSICFFSFRAMPPPMPACFRYERRFRRRLWRLQSSLMLSASSHELIYAPFQQVDYFHARPHLQKPRGIARKASFSRRQVARSAPRPIRSLLLQLVMNSFTDDFSPQSS